MAKSNSPSQWLGLDPAQAEDLRRYLCQISIRPDLIGRATDDSILPVTRLRVGRVAGLAFDHIKDNPDINGTKTLQLKKIGKHVFGEWTGTKVREYFDGKPVTMTKIDSCVGKTKQVLEYVLLGEDSSNPDPQTATIKEDIESYFFRHFKEAREDSLRFLDPTRAHWGAPWSIQELGHEIAWYAREANVHGHSAEMVYVSGESPFLFGLSVAKDIRKAILELVSSPKGSVSLIYPQRSTENQIAAGALRDEASKISGNTNTGISLNPLPDYALNSTPRMNQYIYLRSRNATDHERVHLIRDLDGADPGIASKTALCLRCSTDIELDRFKKWVASVSNLDN